MKLLGWPVMAVPASLCGGVLEFPGSPFSISVTSVN
jgi:hypothetical protein